MQKPRWASLIEPYIFFNAWGSYPNQVQYCHIWTREIGILYVIYPHRLFSQEREIYMGTFRKWGVDWDMFEGLNNFGIH